MMFYLLLVILCLVIAHCFIKYNSNARRIDKLPGPTPLPFIGNLLLFNLPPEKIWQKIMSLLDEYYPIFRIWGFAIFGAFIRHPDDLKVILSCRKNMNKCKTGYDNLRICGNDGLILSTKDKWAHRRALLDPAFHLNLLKIYAEIADEHVTKFINDLQSYENGTALDIMPICYEFSLGVICEAAMGVNLNSVPTEEKERYTNAFDEVSKMTYYRASRPYIQDWMLKFLSIGRKQAKAFKIMRDFSKKIIQERQEYWNRVGWKSYQSFIEDAGGNSTMPEIRGRKKRLAVLDLLLEAKMKNLIDDKGVEDEMDIFVAAGYDTTGTSISFALFLLAENREAQDLARAEVSKILKESGGKLTFAEIQKMDYLDRCVKESLRLFPGVPIFGRVVTEELQLRNYKLPVTTELFIVIFAIHRDPEFWPEPTKFDPDRFLPEQIQKRHPFAYLPFSAGPRNCIGRKFATMEIKLAVARVLHNFIIEPVDSSKDMEFLLSITLTPKKPLYIKLKKINEQ